MEQRLVRLEEIKIHTLTASLHEAANFKYQILCLGERNPDINLMRFVGPRDCMDAVARGDNPNVDTGNKFPTVIDFNNVFVTNTSYNFTYLLQA
jgi:hypothetical protein